MHLMFAYYQMREKQNHFQNFVKMRVVCVIVFPSFKLGITDKANVKAVTSAPLNPTVHNAKWDLGSDRFDL